MTSSPHGPYAWGCTRTTMGRTERSDVARPSQSQKPFLSSDCGLQPAHMKLELLVTARQQSAVNTFPVLVHTARHVMRAGDA